MKKLLIALLFITPAYADISVCVNSTTGKARFATACSKKETQQMLGSVGSTEPTSTVRITSKRVTIPAGTLPGSMNNDQFTPNVIAELSCNKSEDLLDYQIKNAAYPSFYYKWDDDNVCSAWSDGISPTVVAYCGKGYDSSIDTYNPAPTTAPVSIYLVAYCVRK